MPAPSYINIEYFFYHTYLFLKKSYFYFINLPWPTYVFWARVIAVILLILFVAGIIYNLAGISRLRKK